LAWSGTIGLHLTIVAPLKGLAVLGLAIFSLFNRAAAEDLPRYLAFQIFTATSNSTIMREIFPPPREDLGQVISDLQDRIGVAETGKRQIGFILGPIAFDNTDEQVREMIASGFDIALKTGVAVGFHIDDSMFWDRLKELNTPQNIEWLDWNGAPNTGRRLNWDPPNAIEIAPQLCLNSKGVQSAVKKRATLVGSEIAKGVQELRKARRDDLYIGVIAGWETEIGKDFATRRSLGYCALTNAGYSEKNPPPDMDAALSKIVRDFIETWTQALTVAGAPTDKIYSHIALASEKSPSSAFCDLCIPGLSTYPFPGLLDEWRKALAQHANPAWASCEGTALDPRDARQGGPGMSMEGYLGNLFNHGAVMVNIFGWGVGDEENPFRRIAENPDSLAAYRKFLSGDQLAEAPVPGVIATLPAGLQDKIRKLQATLPEWLPKHGPAQIQGNVDRLKQALEDRRFDDAEKSVDALLKTMGQ
jgi:hypothetical protein